MIIYSKKIWQRWRDYRADESGIVTLSFVLAFPVFIFIFLMTFESGMINLRKTMVEHSVDRAVREVRIGRTTGNDVDRLRQRICEKARVIPNCESELRIEMIRRDVRDWVPIDGAAQCVNREDPDDGDDTFDRFGNNELMYLRICVRVNPFLPTTRIGLRLVEDADAAAGSSYAIVSSAAFVVEPFRVDD